MSRFSWPRFPLHGPDRRKALAQSRGAAKEVKERGVRQKYFYLDSRLLSSGPGQSIDAPYQDSFKQVLLNEGLDSFLIRTQTPIVATKGMIVVDIGGPGRQVMKDIREIGTRPTNELAFGVKRSLGIVIEDYQPNKNEEDASVRHTVLEADLLEDSTEDKVDEWLGGEKINVLFERMAGGLEVFPNDPNWFAGRLQRWYGRLDEGGVMLLQVPAGLNRYLREWSDLVAQKYGDVLEVECQYGYDNSEIGRGSALLIRKLQNAPAALPMLDSRAVREMMEHHNEVWDIDGIEPPTVAAPPTEEEG